MPEPSRRWRSRRAAATSAGSADGAARRASSFPEFFSGVDVFSPARGAFLSPGAAVRRRGGGRFSAAGVCVGSRVGRGRRLEPDETRSAFRRSGISDREVRRRVGDLDDALQDETQATGGARRENRLLARLSGPGAEFVALVTGQPESLLCRRGRPLQDRGTVPACKIRFSRGSGRRNGGVGERASRRTGGRFDGYLARLSLHETMPARRRGRRSLRRRSRKRTTRRSKKH